MFQHPDQVILVNEADEQTGVMDKLEAHKLGVLHRAFSIFIFNDNMEMLIQQRADSKYHSAGLWSNACCSHPRPGEDVSDAAHRRLQEELGFDCLLKPLYHFQYKAGVGNGLIEHELDHVFLGRYSGPLLLNREEAKAYKFISLEDLNGWIEKEPAAFTYWFRMALPKLIAHL